MNISNNQNSSNQEYETTSDIAASTMAELEKAFSEIENVKYSSPDAPEPKEEIEEEESTKPEVEEETTQDEELEEEVTEPEEEEIKVEEDTPEAKKKEKKEEKLWKIKRDKYRVLAEKEVLMKENLELKQMLNQSLNSGTYHYGKSAYADLERAKESKKKAIENGDVDALLESDVALSKALHVVNDLEKWSYEQEQYKAPKPEPIKQPESEVRYTEMQHEIASDWLENHPYLQPGSAEYNSKIANKVSNFINYLDSSLVKEGNRDAYFSDDYFQTIDNYISGIKKEISKPLKKPDSSAYVGGVRNSYSNSSTNKNNSNKQITLTANERMMCANAGISEKEWLKYKLDDLKRGK